MNPNKPIWAALVLALSLPLQAVPIVSLNPSASSIGIGDTVTVDLNITGLGNPATPALGAWLAQLSYSNTILDITASNVVFGSHLDLGLFGSLRFIDDTVSGVIEADEVSFEDSADLVNSQPTSFTLASFTFTGTASGISMLTFDRLELSDENGYALNFTSSNISITVFDGARVPEDVSMTLPLIICTGMIVLVRQRKCRL